MSQAQTGDSPKLAYTVAEVAEMCSVSVRSIWRMVRAGELTTFKWCGRTLIRADVLQQALDRASGEVAA